MHPSRRNHENRQATRAGNPAEKAQLFRNESHALGAMAKSSTVLPLMEGDSAKFAAAPLIDMPDSRQTATLAPAGLGEAGEKYPDFSEDLDKHDFAWQTRAEVETLLREACRDNGTPPPAVVNAARKFPDIVQGCLNTIPPWGVSEVRKTSTDPLSSRYVFVGDLKAGPAEGIYHVNVLHNGATMTVSRTSRFRGRVIHDPFNVSPEEFERAAFVFLKTYAYLKDPAQVWSLVDMTDTRENREVLAAQYVAATRHNPFGLTTAAVAEVKAPATAPALLSDDAKPAQRVRRVRAP